MEGSTPERKMDSWYSWVVCAALFFIEFIVMGLYTSFGTLFVALIEEFNASESSAAWVGSVAFSICYLSSFLVNMLLPRIGYRAVCCIGATLFGTGLLISSFANSISVLFVTYGIVYGVGCGLIHFTGIFVIPMFFKYKRGIAYGIALSGHGIGALPVGYMIDLLISNFGLRITLRMCSILAVPLFVCGLTFGSTRVKKKCKCASQSELEKFETKSSNKIWKNKALVAFSIAMWMNGFGYYIPSVHLINMAEGQGVSLMQATLLPSTIAIAQSVGKIVFGQIAMWYRNINVVYCCQATLFICGLVTTFCPLLTSFGGMLSYTIVYGFFDACSTVFSLKVIEDIVGEHSIDSGYSFEMVGMAIFMLMGPPAAGFLYEITGSYAIPFFLSGGFSTLCVCLLFLVPFLKDKNTTPMDYSEKFMRKVSILSTSSTSSSSSEVSRFSDDSGISLQMEAERTENEMVSARKPSVSSSLSSSSCDGASLSDYETDEVLELTYSDEEKDSIQISINDEEQYCLNYEKIKDSCWLIGVNDNSLEDFTAARETVV